MTDIFIAIVLFLLAALFLLVIGVMSVGLIIFAGKGFEYLRKLINREELS